jgi:hypothetical protein
MWDLWSPVSTGISEIGLPPPDDRSRLCCFFTAANRVLWCHLSTMKSIDIKSLIIGALLTSTIFLGVAATGTTDKWDGKQRWEIKTSSGKIPEGWEPFAYDSNDEFDPFLLRKRTK